MVAQEFDLNLIPGGVMPILNVSQYDVGTREFAFLMKAGSEDYYIVDGITATVRGYRPDHTAFSLPCDIINNNIVVFTVTAEMTSVKGCVQCEIRLTDGDYIIGSGNFIMMVEPSPIDEESLVSQTNLPYRVLQGMQGSSVSSMNNIWKYLRVVDFSLPRGKWLVLAQVSFSANSSGTRGLAISTTSTGSEFETRVPACAGGVTVMQTMALLQPSTETTYHINVGFNIIADLTVSINWQAIELV